MKSKLFEAEKSLLIFVTSETSEYLVLLISEPMIISRDEISLLLKRKNESTTFHFSLAMNYWFQPTSCVWKAHSTATNDKLWRFFLASTLNFKLKEIFYQNKYALVMHNKFSRSFETFSFFIVERTTSFEWSQSRKSHRHLIADDVFFS